MNLRLPSPLIQLLIIVIYALSGVTSHAANGDRLIPMILNFMNHLARKSSVLTLMAFTASASAAPIKIRVSNELTVPRQSQTIEVTARDLAPLHAKNLNLVHVRDASVNEVHLLVGLLLG